MSLVYRRLPLAVSAAVLLGLGFLTPIAFAQESNVEILLAQADEFLRKNEPALALGTYLEAASVSKDPLNLSRAYFGAALSCFYERNMAGATKWSRKVAEVDPNKQISDLFYPKPFVDLFHQILKEAREKGNPSLPAETPPPEKRLEAAVEPPKREETRREEARPPETKRELPPATKTEPRLESFEIPPAPAESGFRGRLEVSAHYSSWTVDPIASLFESSVVDELAEELQNEVIKKLGSSYAGLVKGPFTHVLDLDSEGSNYGFEVRYYVRGWAGTFSFGLGIEQTRFRLGLTGTVKQEFINGGVAEVAAEAFVETSPFSPHASFRWEIGRPEARLKPYFVFGLGIAPLRGTFSYSYNGTYRYASISDTIEDAKTKDFDELSEDIDFHIPRYLALVQLDLGLKVELFKGLFVLGEAGIWDGLLLRGGLGYRF
jgi:hypothetical protein